MELNNINTLRNVDKEKLQEVFNQSTSVSNVLSYFGFIPQRKDSRKLINSLILSYSIDLTKMHENLKIKLSEQCSKIDRGKPFEFVKGKFVGGSELIKHLKKIQHRMICSECGIGEEYNNKPISLQVHHIDGDNTNNVIENLQILCPNCHSQTDSFCGKKNRKPIKYCKCGEQILRTSKMCRKCTYENRLIKELDKERRKFEISKEELEILIKEHPMTKIGKMLGVSDNSVKKRCRLLGIELKPMRGYWRKLQTGKIERKE